MENGGLNNILRYKRCFLRSQCLQCGEIDSVKCAVHNQRVDYSHNLVKGQCYDVDDERIALWTDHVIAFWCTVSPFRCTVGHCSKCEKYYKSTLYFHDFQLVFTPSKERDFVIRYINRDMENMIQLHHELLNHEIAEKQRLHARAAAAARDQDSEGSSSTSRSTAGSSVGSSIECINLELEFNNN